MIQPLNYIHRGGYVQKPLSIPSLYGIITHRTNFGHWTLIYLFCHLVVHELVKHHSSYSMQGLGIWPENIFPLRNPDCCLPTRDPGNVYVGVFDPPSPCVDLFCCLVLNRLCLDSAHSVLSWQIIQNSINTVTTKV